MLDNLLDLSETEIIQKMEMTLEEIRRIDTQLTASRQRLSEIKAKPNSVNRQEYRDELDWRRRATFAKQKFLEEYIPLKNRLKAIRVERDVAGNQFTNRLKAAAQFVIMAYDHDLDIGAAVEGLRVTLGEAAP